MTAKYVIAAADKDNGCAVASRMCHDVHDVCGWLKLFEVDNERIFEFRTEARKHPFSMKFHSARYMIAVDPVPELEKKMIKDYESISLAFAVDDEGYSTVQY